jgi:pectinesterase
MREWIVAKEGICDFNTIQEGINAASGGDCIFIRKGIYREKVTINKSNLKIIGDSKENTCTVYDDCALKVMEDGSKMGTFRSYTLYLGGDNLYIENLTIENDAEDGNKAGQAIAVYADGDDIVLDGCRLIGHQDTLFTAPLPKAPKIPGSFVGPSEHKIYRHHRQMYINCFIQGDIDFIFGSAEALFYNCTIHSNNRKTPINGYIAAPSTWEHEEKGYLFLKCKFTSDTNIASVYLARPWRPFGKAEFINCYFGEHILPEYFDYWNDEKNKETARFREALNYGPGIRKE